uniref:Uncharacterized protein n=1 Tax=mine drainage metagenome TaxID=410659 RepID=E6Q6P9_9ZZZZ
MAHLRLLEGFTVAFAISQYCVVNAVRGIKRCNSADLRHGSFRKVNDEIWQLDATCSRLFQKCFLDTIRCALNAIQKHTPYVCAVHTPSLEDVAWLRISSLAGVCRRENGRSRATDWLQALAPPKACIIFYGLCKGFQIQLHFLDPILGARPTDTFANERSLGLLQVAARIVYTGDLTRQAQCNPRWAFFRRLLASDAENVAWLRYPCQDSFTNRNYYSQ